MEARGLSDEKIANRIGVARETVTRWRNQQHRLNPDKIAALAAALDCKPEALWQPPHPEGTKTADTQLEEVLQKIADLADIIKKTGT
jgi:transcriptional regulator with XRE-family HTH domain